MGFYKTDIDLAGIIIRDMTHRNLILSSDEDKLRLNSPSFFFSWWKYEELMERSSVLEYTYKLWTLTDRYISSSYRFYIDFQVQFKYSDSSRVKIYSHDLHQVPYWLEISPLWIPWRFEIEKCIDFQMKSRRKFISILKWLRK